MPAALAAGAAGARVGGRESAPQGGDRERIGRRRRQAQGERVRSGQALLLLVEGQGDSERRLRGWRLYQGQGLARAVRSAASRLLGKRQAALCLARRLRF